MVDAAVFVEQLQRGFEALRETVNRSRIEALVVHAADFKDEADLTGLGQKDVRTDEAKEIDLLVERAGLAVVFEDAAKSEHGRPFGPKSG